ncbi:hypothetical protein EDC56_3238 [Sinobacterium caligoides]|uniref:Uncharacterized protein n=1 Tax=Sinobacterium caligoides TaxID=933926 RepID=A0A3N2DH96_9GAMM|nr:filamentous hemagglutinin N-terminal domain-containing protein [Sinobacterium caligoides]ROR98998.1 hypothetical protein EDC56_3238 [Sinobacterium caligoides]
MKMQRLSLRRLWCVAAVCALLPTLSQANTITPTSAGSAVTHASSSGLDVLKPVKANANGLSINHFSQFKLNNNDLQILNVAADEDSTAATTIVLIANEFLLQQHIELVGAPANLVLLSTANAGDISCFNCSFTGFHRLSLSAARSDSNFSHDVGVLASTPGGQVTVDNLDAAGILSVELQANNVVLQGPINTHLAATKNSQGQYQAAPVGSHSIGAGGVNLMLGRLSWDYDQQQITRSQSSGSATLNGSIRSTDVLINSASPLTLNTSIDSRSDAIASQYFNGASYLPVERVRVHDFGSGTTTINGTIRSNRSVAINSGGALQLNKAGNLIHAYHVELIAKNKLFNSSTISGNELHLAGGQLVNRGSLNAEQRLEAWADYTLANEFGGEISGASMLLQSARGIVRNGSRTPYIPTVENNTLLTINSNEAYQYQKGGTYYRSGMNVDGKGQKTSDLSGKITANILEIKARAFENINPVWKKNRSAETESQFKHKNICMGANHPLIVVEGDWENRKAWSPTFDNVFFHEKDQKQVSISAETTLSIVTSDYILNSSAEITLNHSVGSINFQSKQFLNERYRSAAGLIARSWEFKMIFCDSGNPNLALTTDKFEFASRRYIDSPSATLISLANLKARLTQRFYNNAAYIEIYGDAYFDSPRVSDIGNSHAKEDYFTADYHNAVDKHSVVEKQTDSLFLIHGNTYGRKVATTESPYTTKLSVENINVLDQFKAQAGATVTENTTKEETVTMYRKIVELAKQMAAWINSLFDEMDWWN